MNDFDRQVSRRVGDFVRSGVGRSRVYGAGALLLAFGTWIALAQVNSGPTADPSSSWGPLAVIDSDSAPDARLAGQIRMVRDCVVLTSAGGDWSLVFNVRLAQWDADRRAVVLRAAEGGEITIRDGDDVVLGGAAAFGDDPAIDYDVWSRTVKWVAPPGSQCDRSAVWVVGTGSHARP